MNQNSIISKNGYSGVIAGGQFAKDVVRGLTARPKYLSSKYFYDEKGDALFQRIMKLDEYYLTRCEFEILDRYKRELLEHFQGGDAGHFDLIEFGAGDGYKTKALLTSFLQQEARFKYMPIDISASVLDQLTNNLKDSFPTIKTEGLQGDYFESLGRLNKMNGQARKALLFLGSNIGNFSHESAVDFLSKLRSLLNPGDMILIGFDLVKDPDIILSAYNDAAGVTRAFNLNLLDRINRELGGNFNTAAFKHVATYNPQTGEARSFLVSLKKQSVALEKLGVRVGFFPWESIFMEVSRKFAPTQIAKLAAEAGFKVCANFYDERKYFVDALWKAK